MQLTNTRFGFSRTIRRTKETAIEYGLLILVLAAALLID